ncbi:MAG: MarR family transcriptional regulator, partial [Treponemataceae bacterium]|nr:MarR family transcriptional regulator [Treponemataceae bacterium]
MDYGVDAVVSLISRIHSLSQDFLRRKMTEAGLPELVSSHGFMLFCLSRTEQMTLGELAQRINRDKSTTTVLVRKLET